VIPALERLSEDCKFETNLSQKTKQNTTKYNLFLDDEKFHTSFLVFV
jgi:hypothetical protein